MIKKKKWAIFILSIFTAGFLYNLDAISGQWKFKRLCKTEGGPRFYMPVKKNVGWMVEAHGEWSYQPPFYFGDVQFTRYENEKGEKFDVYTEGRNTKGKRIYLFREVDKSKPVRYLYRYTQAEFSDDKRFSWEKEEIIDLKTNQIAASYTTIGYEWTTPERVILAAPTGKSCWNNSHKDFYEKIYD